MMQECVSDYDGSVAVFQDANRKFTSIKDVDARRKRIWLAIAKRDIPKVCYHNIPPVRESLTYCNTLYLILETQLICK